MTASTIDFKQKTLSFINLIKEITNIQDITRKWKKLPVIYPGYTTVWHFDPHSVDEYVNNSFYCM